MKNKKYKNTFFDNLPVLPPPFFFREVLIKFCPKKQIKIRDFLFREYIRHIRTISEEGYSLPLYDEYACLVTKGEKTVAYIGIRVETPIDFKKFEVRLLQEFKKKQEKFTQKDMNRIYEEVYAKTKTKIEKKREEERKRKEAKEKKKQEIKIKKEKKDFEKRLPKIKKQIEEMKRRAGLIDNNKK